jgi:hypothetical protein
VLDEKGHYSEAEELAGKVLTIGEKRGELTGPVRWLTTSVRGGALAGLGRFAEAQPLLVGLYDLIKDRADVTPAEKRRTLDRVIRLYDSWDAAEPEKGYAEKVEEFRTLLEAKHEDAAGK